MGRDMPTTIEFNAFGWHSTIFVEWWMVATGLVVAVVVAVAVKRFLGAAS